MILSYELKKEQLRERLNLKSAEQAFSHQIVNGTNCSPFESEIIVEKAKRRIHKEFHGNKYLFEHTGTAFNSKYITNQIRCGSRLSLGKDISAHSLRHSWAMEKLKQTGNLNGEQISRAFVYVDYG